MLFVSRRGPDMRRIATASVGRRRGRRGLLLILAALGLLALACGGGSSSGLSADSLPPLVLQPADLPPFFSEPQVIDDFPLPAAVEIGVSAKYFVSYADRPDGTAQEFLMSGVAIISNSDDLDYFFADAGTAIDLALSDIGRDLESVQVVALTELGSDAVGVVYFPGGDGRQDIVIFRRGNVLGYVALFKPIDVEGFIDIGAAAAIMDGRIGEFLRAGAAADTGS